MSNNTEAGPEVEQQVLAMAKVIMALGLTIRDSNTMGPGTLPAGHLYTMVMGDLDLDEFESCIKVLVDAKLVERDPSHLLRWIGPPKSTSSTVELPHA